MSEIFDLEVQNDVDVYSEEETGFILKISQEKSEAIIEGKHFNLNNDIVNKIKDYVFKNYNDIKSCEVDWDNILDGESYPWITLKYDNEEIEVISEQHVAAIQTIVIKELKIK